MFLFWNKRWSATPPVVQKTNFFLYIPFNGSPMCQRLRITLRSETKPLSLFWRKALGLWIFDNSNVDVCEIQWWFLLKRKTKPLPLFWRRRWVFEFLTSVMLMCVKYNDDSCWKENKTSSTLLEKALGLWILDISKVVVYKIQWWFLLKGKQNLFHFLEEDVGSLNFWPQ